MGAAVQSHWFSVGSIVTWGEAGVGVVATQSFTNPSFGPRGLELLRRGRGADEVVEELVTADDGRDVRQVAVLGPAGPAAAYTGRRCIPHCGHLTGDGFSVQANTMVSKEVWPAMAAAFEGAAVPLEERMLAALEAAEAAGGDLRGSQSAAILVVKGSATGHIWEDRAIDLRVEDHPRPVEELRRLVGVHRAYRDMNEGDAALERRDTVAALRHYGSARARCPQNEEMMFWQAAMLANNGRWEEAEPLFLSSFARNEHWREVLPDLVRLEHVLLDQERLDRLLRS